MRNEVKNRNMGLQGSLPQAPAGGTGADLKTTPSWGGPNDGRAGAALARLEGPMGPRIAASAASATSNTSNGSNASAVPEGLAVRRYKRIVAYRVPNFEAFVGLIAELLFKISRSSRGSVVRVNGRKLARYLGLSGTIHSIDLSVIYSLLVRLGFEIMRTSRGAIVVISMDKPVMKEVRAAKDVNEAIEIVRKHLGE